MKKRLLTKLRLLVVALLIVFLILSSSVFGQVFFINRTKSMPTGIYRKNFNKNVFSVGDIVVVSRPRNNINLIKYVAGQANSIFCSDETGILWVDGKPVAQKNIEKYPGSFLQQSVCDEVKSDELLVLGDHENSFDSRYFGPIKSHDVVTAVTLFWSF